MPFGYWRVLVVPTLSRRSGDVGSLPPPRSSRSKPRTPLSIRRRPVRAYWWPRAGQQVYRAARGVRFARASVAPGGHRRRWVRRPAVRQITAGQTGRRVTRRSAQLPPLHAAVVPGRELSPEPFGDHGTAAQGVPGRAERPLPRGRRHRGRLRAQGRAPRRRVRPLLRLPRRRDGQHDQLLRQREHPRPRPRAQGSRRGAATAQPRAGVPRTGYDRAHRSRAHAAAHVLHRRRRPDRSGVHGRAGRARPARPSPRISRASGIVDADPVARRRRPAPDDVRAPVVEIRAAGARTARRRRAHQHARQLRGRRGSGAARRQRDPDRDDGVDRRRTPERSRARTPAPLRGRRPPAA